MKKIYALIACVAAAGTMTLSAQKELPFNDPATRLENAPIYQLDKHAKAPKINKNMVDKRVGLSRGTTVQEVIDECDALLYYDYFFNWNDYPANSTESVSRDEWRNLRSGQYGNLAENGDEYMIEDFLQYGIDIPVHVSDEGEFYITAGELLYTNSSYKFYSAILYYDPEEDSYAGTLEGNYPLTFYTDGICFEDENGETYWIGIYVKSLAGENEGWGCIGAYPIWVNSNATLSVEQRSTAEGWVDSDDIRLFAYYTVADPDDEDSLDKITVSYIMPLGFGTAVNIEFFEGDAYFIDQTAASSEWTGEAYTGDFFVTQGVIQGEYVTLGGTVFDVTWDEDTQVLSYEDYWICAAESGYSYRWNYGLTILFDEGWRDGIKSVIADDNNSNEAPVYYNLQGMRVVNPKAGQIYIVKQGNKSTKQIYR